MAAEAMYAAADLGRGDQVRRHAAGALTPVDGMQRRRVLATVALANSYLPTAHSTVTSGGSAEIDHACNVVRDVIPVIGSLTSARALTAVNQFRARLASYGNHPAVQELEHDLRETVDTG
jgi:hypothetical protein